MPDGLDDELIHSEELEGGVGPHVRETWTRPDRTLHRLDGPAVIVRDPQSGEIILEEFYEDGALHRDGGPARTERIADDWDDPKIRYEYYSKGKEHRLDGPAIRWVNQRTGITVVERWAVEGLTEREGGPAAILRDRETGIATYEGWYINNRYFRVGGPALSQRDPQSGITVREEWIEHNRRNRPKGAAVILRDEETGLITKREFWHAGKKTAEGGPMGTPVVNCEPEPP